MSSSGLFFADHNGSLRTSQVLDYEPLSDHPYLPIVVQATDEHNFTITKHFVVEVTDSEWDPELALPAIVRTLDPIDHGATGYNLQGEILTNGNSFITESGFWVSKSILLKIQSV